MEGLKKSFLVRGNNIVGFSDKNFSTCPIGTVLSFAGNTVPHGYLLADGASYPTADYPDLYAVIGNTYGGDSTNFNVPNLVDKFVQGSTTSGTEKEAGLPNITGGWMPSVPVGYQNYATGAVVAEVKSSGLVSLAGTQAAIGAGFKIDASKSSAVYGNSTTVQPPALTMVYIIKAFHTNEGVDSKNEVSDPIIEYVDNKISSNLGEKVDYKVVVEDGIRYVEDIVVQDINTWLPNDNSSIVINLKKANGANYSNFQLLCNKQDSKNWSCIVNGAAHELWKIRYVNGVRYIYEIATMDKVNDLGSYINGVKLTPTTDGNLENQVDIGTIKLPKGKWIIFASGWNPTDAYGSETIIGLKGSVDFIRQYNTVMFNFSVFRNVTTETTYTLTYSQGSGTSKNVATNYNFYAVKVGL